MIFTIFFLLSTFCWKTIWVRKKSDLWKSDSSSLLLKEYSLNIPQKRHFSLRNKLDSWSGSENTKHCLRLETYLQLLYGNQFRKNAYDYWSKSVRNITRSWELDLRFTSEIHVNRKTLRLSVSLIRVCSASRPYIWVLSEGYVKAVPYVSLCQSNPLNRCVCGTASVKEFVKNVTPFTFLSPYNFLRSETEPFNDDNVGWRSLCETEILMGRKLLYTSQCCLCFDLQLDALSVEITICLYTNSRNE